MNETAQGTCWHCGKTLGAHEYGRETNCLACGKPTRVCRNCRWFAHGIANECREPMAERIIDKVRPNYCEFFEPSLDAGRAAAPSPEEDLLKQAEDLFKF